MPARSAGRHDERRPTRVALGSDAHKPDTRLPCYSTGSTFLVVGTDGDLEFICLVDVGRKCRRRRTFVNVLTVAAQNVLGMNECSSAISCS